MTVALGGLTLLILAAGAALTIVTHDLRASFDGVLLVIVVVVGGVGFVVARRQPSNMIGWMLLVASSFFALYAVAVLYAVVDYHEHGGRLPLGRVGLAAEPAWIPGFVLVGLAVAFFPDGRITSARWRPLIYAYAGLGIWFATGWSLSQATLHIGPHFDVDSVGNYLGPQKGFASEAANLAWLASPLIVVLTIAFVARQASVWRGATGERRKQLTWLMCGGAVSVVSIVVVTQTNTSGRDRLITDLAALGLTAVPLAIGVGILKYRLYEIDRLISRTVSYLILTGLLVGVFVGIDRARNRRAAVLLTRRRRRVDPRGGSAVQPVAQADPARGRPPLQPRPLRRRGDRRRLHRRGSARRSTSRRCAATSSLQSAAPSSLPTPRSGSGRWPMEPSELGQMGTRPRSPASSAKPMNRSTTSLARRSRLQARPMSLGG